LVALRIQRLSLSSSFFFGCGRRGRRHIGPRRVQEEVPSRLCDAAPGSFHLAAFQLALKTLRGRIGTAPLLRAQRTHADHSPQSTCKFRTRGGRCPTLLWRHRNQRPTHACFIVVYPRFSIGGEAQKGRGPAWCPTIFQLFRPRRLTRKDKKSANVFHMTYLLFLSPEKVNACAGALLFSNCTRSICPNIRRRSFCSFPSFHLRTVHS